MLVFKINSIPTGGQTALKARAEKAWTITPKKISGENKAIVMYKGLVLEEYLINSFHHDQQDPTKIAFDLTPIQNSLLKGQKAYYPTSNPCTTTSKLTIKV